MELLEVASSIALLDNPIWNALNTDHAEIALGGELARKYPGAIGPLSGMPEQSAKAYAELATLAEKNPVVMFLEEKPQVPAGWTILQTGAVYQMVNAEPVLNLEDAPKDVTLRLLTAEDAPAMVELADLTKPGPFRLRTIELGNFYGILRDGKLLAMAGKRTHVPGFVEVSAVCTHPDARGRGFARMAMERVIAEIVADGRRPYLHTYAGNDVAIRLYEQMGFAIRRGFEFAALAPGS